MSLSANREEYRVGDMIWAELNGADQNYGHGEIAEIWFEESINEECFNFHCLINGGYRMSTVSKIIENPNVRMTNKLAESRKDYLEAMKNKWPCVTIKMNYYNINIIKKEYNMDIQTIKNIIEPSIQNIVDNLTEQNINIKKTILKKLIDEALTKSLTGSDSKSSEVSMMFSGRGRAWAMVQDTSSLYNKIISFLRSQNNNDVTDLIDLFETNKIVWMRYNNSNRANVVFNLRYKGSKLEDSIHYNVAYHELEEIQNLEGVPHRLGLESGNFSEDKISIKRIDTLEEESTSTFNLNIININDLL